MWPESPHDGLGKAVFGQSHNEGCRHQARAVYYLRPLATFDLSPPLSPFQRLENFEKVKT